MARPPAMPHAEQTYPQVQKGGKHMTADQIKAKFRNFPEAELLRRIAAARKS